jgi:hypothetical protein
VRASQQGRSRLEKGRAVGEGRGEFFRRSRGQRSTLQKQRLHIYTYTYTRTPEVILGRGAVGLGEWEVAVEGV